MRDADEELHRLMAAGFRSATKTGKARELEHGPVADCDRCQELLEEWGRPSWAAR